MLGAVMAGGRPSPACIRWMHALSWSAGGHKSGVWVQQHLRGLYKQPAVQLWSMAATRPSLAAGHTPMGLNPQPAQFCWLVVHRCSAAVGTNYGLSTSGVPAAVLRPVAGPRKHRTRPLSQ